MTNELCWDAKRVEMERKKALRMIEVDMGKMSKKVSSSSIVLTACEVQEYTEKFRNVAGSKGFITHVDIGKLMKDMEVNIDEKELQLMIDEVDLNNNGKVELDEFLMLMSDLQHGNVRTNALASLLRSDRNKICVPVDKSGGGL